MGYTVSSRAITRVFDHLNQLVAAEKNIEWNVDNPKEFAYRLREAIKVATDRSNKGDGEPYDSYAKLRLKYVFRERPNKVIAELRDVLIVNKVQSSFSTVTLPEIEDGMSAAGACIMHRGKSVSFPSMNGTEDDFALLRNWANANNCNIIVNDDGVRVEPKS